MLFDNKLVLDPAHAKLDFRKDPLIQDVTRDKYLQIKTDGQYETFDQMCVRVASAVMGNDAVPASYISELMQMGVWMPGGRICAGAGTEKTVTLMNCYVNEKMDDSMIGIHRALGNVMFTLQQGGGIGTDFSTLRPSGAQLKRTGQGSKASGPIPFMAQFNATSLTVKSAGDRRGAMMATLSDTHPDLPAYIVAKQEKGALEQFNISILVSDAFMECVAMDEDWLLYFPIPPVNRDSTWEQFDFEDENGVRQYVYSVQRARYLWELITKNTYEYSEPGIIFIDRVNELNNLYYTENIRCTNPCGEQPLPPNGTCNLGAINLSRLVRDPFKPTAEIDFDALEIAAKAGIRFLDNVIDVTRYPLEAQRDEEHDKRRTGLGISGLADMLAQLGIRYGSVRSASVTEQVMHRIAVAVYEESSTMAGEKGVFPLFEKDKYLEAEFIKKLPKYLRDMIGDVGIRNSVLLTIAPTGTTSIAFGNGSSGLEPNFSWKYDRKVHQADGSWKTYKNVEPYLIKLYTNYLDGVPNNLPDFMVTSQDLDIMDHLRIQAACQKWVDASVSKTINIPTETPYEEFQDVYLQAYQMGCKGCTTYRYSDVRGSILSIDGGSDSGNKDILPPRPEVLRGYTYKIKWPSWSASIYVTINHDGEDKPFEIFIQSKDARHQEWITALTLMISAIFRKGGNVAFVSEELRQIQSTHDTSWHQGKFYPSLVSRIADTIDQHFEAYGITKGTQSTTTTMISGPSKGEADQKGEPCPQCSAPALVYQEGCKKCTNCGYSNCG